MLRCSCMLACSTAKRSCIFSVECHLLLFPTLPMYTFVFTFKSTDSTLASCCCLIVLSGYGCPAVWALALFVCIDSFAVSYALVNSIMTCGSEGTGKGLAWACCQAFVQSISSCSQLLSSYYLHWNLSWVTLRSRAGRGGSFPVPKEQICYVVVAYSESWGQVIMTVPFYFFLIFFF